MVRGASVPAQRADRRPVALEPLALAVFSPASPRRLQLSLCLAYECGKLSPTCVPRLTLPPAPDRTCAVLGGALPGAYNGVFYAQRIVPRGYVAGTDVVTPPGGSDGTPAGGSASDGSGGDSTAGGATQGSGSTAGRTDAIIAGSVAGGVACVALGIAGFYAWRRSKSAGADAALGAGAGAAGAARTVGSHGTVHRAGPFAPTGHVGAGGASAAAPGVPAAPGGGGGFSTAMSPPASAPGSRRRRPAPMEEARKQGEDSVTLPPSVPTAAAGSDAAKSLAAADAHDDATPAAAAARGSAAGVGVVNAGAAVPMRSPAEGGSRLAITRGTGAVTMI
jgi:hypothetical protein